MALTDRGVERRHIGVVQLIGHRRHGSAVHQALQRKSAAADFAGDRFLAGFQRPLAPLLGKPLADLGLGAG